MSSACCYEGVFLRCCVVIIPCFLSGRRMIGRLVIISPNEFQLFSDADADADADETSPIP